MFQSFIKNMLFHPDNLSRNGADNQHCFRELGVLINEVKLPKARARHPISVIINRSLSSLRMNVSPSVNLTKLC